MSGYLNVYDLIEGHSQSSYKIANFYKDFKLVSEKSFEEIRQDVLLAAEKLASRLQKNEIFFLSLPNSYEFLVLFLGSLKAGVIPAPIANQDFLSKAEYFDYLDQLKSQTQIQKILVPENLRAEMVKSGFEVVSVNVESQYAKSGMGTEAFLNNPQKPKFLPEHLFDQIAYVQFSSGSTSDPKGIMISHKALIENITMTRQALELNDRSIILSAIPFFHDMGLVGSLLTSLVTPSELHILSPNDFAKTPERFLELSTRVKATVWVGTDPMYRRLIKALEKGEFSTKIDLGSLQICLCGAEPVLAETFKSFSQAAIPFGWKPYTFTPCYGQAENVLSISFASWRTHLKTHEKNRRTIVSCGKPAGNIKIQILDENQKLMNDGLEGFIWIQSPSLCSGFLEKEDVFKESLLGSWFFTGDLGFVKDEELYISGRFKDMVILNSRKYFSEDLEQQVWNLVGHDKRVKKVAVVGRGSIGANEGISVCMEWYQRIPFFSFQQRQEYRKKIIHHFKDSFKLNENEIHFVAVGTLPRTTSRKIKRYKIRTQIAMGQLKSGLWNIFWRSWVGGFSKN